MCKQHFTVAAAQSGAGFNYFRYSQLDLCSGFQPRGQAPPKCLQIHLNGLEVINRGEKKSCHTCILYSIA